MVVYLRNMKRIEDNFMTKVFLPIAWLGVGHWGSYLIQDIIQLEAVKEIAVFDPEEIRLEKMHRQYPGIRIVQSGDDV